MNDKKVEYVNGVNINVLHENISVLLDKTRKALDSIEKPYYDTTTFDNASDELWEAIAKVVLPASDNWPPDAMDSPEYDRYKKYVETSPMPQLKPPRAP